MRSIHCLAFLTVSRHLAVGRKSVHGKSSSASFAQHQLQGLFVCDTDFKPNSSANASKSSHKAQTTAQKPAASCSPPPRKGLPYSSSVGVSPSQSQKKTPTNLRKPDCARPHVWRATFVHHGLPKFPNEPSDHQCATPRKHPPPAVDDRALRHFPASGNHWHSIKMHFYWQATREKICSRPGRVSIPGWMVLHLLPKL